MKINKEILTENIGFFFEVLLFFLSGVLFVRGQLSESIMLFVKSIMFLIIGLGVAFVVGQSIFERGKMEGKKKCR